MAKDGQRNPKDIANARKGYNNSVKIMNNKVQVFPNNLFAKMFGFSKLEMLEIEEKEKQNIKINLINDQDKKMYLLHLPFVFIFITK